MITLRFQALIDAGIDPTPREEIKSDARSLVTAHETRDSFQVVVKRFVHQPIRQAAAWLVGLHPAQREIRVNERLRNLHIPVIPIISAGTERVGLGVHVWLATRRTGDSMQRWMRRPDLSAADAERIIDATADLFAKVELAGVGFKDFKPSNVLIDESNQALLIDVGCARVNANEAQKQRMRDHMERIMVRDKISDQLHKRF